MRQRALTGSLLADRPDRRGLQGRCTARDNSGLAQLAARAVQATAIYNQQSNPQQRRDPARPATSNCMTAAYIEASQRPVFMMLESHIWLLLLSSLQKKFPALCLVLLGYPPVASFLAPTTSRSCGVSTILLPPAASTAGMEPETIVCTGQLVPDWRRTLTQGAGCASSQSNSSFRQQDWQECYKPSHPLCLKAMGFASAEQITSSGQSSVECADAMTALACLPEYIPDRSNSMYMAARVHKDLCSISQPASMH